MTSTIKVNNIQNQCGANIINESSDTITLGASGDTVALASGASQTGFGRTGTVDWDTTPKTTTFTAVSGDGFFANTTSGGFNMNLPAGAAGAIVSVADYAATWDTGNLTVVPNGTDKIGGVNANVVLNTKGQSVTFIFVDSTQGWINTMDSTSNERANAFVAATGGTITTCGNYKIHTFTGPGTFCVSSAGTPSGSTEVSYLVVAGGAGGASGNGNGGGGGGAGGYREGKSPETPYTASPVACTSGTNNGLAVSAQGYPITVGAGGSGLGPVPGFMPYAVGNDGSNSIFSTITSTGGGGGGTTPVSSGAGRTGGSGGGAAGGTQCSAGGAGNSPPVSPAQGQNGGSKSPPSSPDIASAGGGGIGAAGQNFPFSPNENGGNGGYGTTTSINGTATGFAGGGGGGADSATKGNDHNWPNGRAATPGVNACATAGFGGGTGGLYSPKVAGTAGSTNKGGGGGGSGSLATGAGGSGIVIIRYKYQ
jgi:hypothetical protein